jgi:hypothetical protein
MGSGGGMVSAVGGVAHNQQNMNNNRENILRKALKCK